MEILIKYMSQLDGKPVDVYEWPDGLEIKDPHTRRTLTVTDEELEQIIENMER